MFESKKHLRADITRLERDIAELKRLLKVLGGYTWFEGFGPSRVVILEDKLSAIEESFGITYIEVPAVPAKKESLRVVRLKGAG